MSKQLSFSSSNPKVQKGCDMSRGAKGYAAGGMVTREGPDRGDMRGGRGEGRRQALTQSRQAAPVMDTGFFLPRGQLAEAGSNPASVAHSQWQDQGRAAYEAKMGEIRRVPSGRRRGAANRHNERVRTEAQNIKNQYGL